MKIQHSQKKKKKKKLNKVIKKKKAQGVVGEEQKGRMGANHSIIYLSV